MVLQVFLEQISSSLSYFLKEEIRNQSLSLFGALYFEKIVRKVKAFLQYLSERPQSNYLEELVEVS